MDSEHFWQLVTTSTPLSSDEDSIANELRAKLEELSDDELRIFDKQYAATMKAAYTWPLWGAAHVITGGCGYDDFIDFRNWLISRGRDVFDRALAEPDSLVDIDISKVENEPMPFVADYDLVAGQVYEERHLDDELPFSPQVPDEPSGEEWQDSPKVLAELYPKLFARFQQ